MDKTITHAQIREAVEEAYNECKDINGGHNADYIPFLANIDPNLFGISVTLLD